MEKEKYFATFVISIYGKKSILEEYNLDLGLLFVGRVSPSNPLRRKWEAIEESDENTEHLSVIWWIIILIYLSSPILF